MRIVATIEARMTSSRLPGKVVLPALGEPMLSHLVRRLQAVGSLDIIILATTVNAEDDVLVTIAEHHGIMVHRGSEHDVLGRVAEAAVAAGAEVVVGITADCPVIDPDLVDQAIRIFVANDVDFVSNSIVRSFPDGMDTNVVRASALADAAAEACSPDDREHTFLFIQRHPERFSRIALVAPPSLHWPELGLTLDESKDYELLKNVIEALGGLDPTFGCHATIDYLKSDPALVAINASVLRRSPSF